MTAVVIIDVVAAADQLLRCNTGVDEKTRQHIAELVAAKVRELVAAAPPLTPEQRAQLAALLAP